MNGIASSRTTMRIVGCMTVLAINPAPVEAASVAQAYCSTREHTVAEKVPPDLVAAVGKTLGIEAAAVTKMAFVRCVGQKLVACYPGANNNLHCGKADTRRDMPAAVAYCREDPGASSIPTAAIGNSSIYAWSCKGSRAVTGKVETKPDAAGYIADYWENVE